MMMLVVVMTMMMIIIIIIIIEISPTVPCHTVTKYCCKSKYFYHVIFNQTDDILQYITDALLHTL
jgi:hypothetical protein